MVDGRQLVVFSANGLRYRYTVSPPGGGMPLGPGDDDGRTAADPRHRRRTRVRTGHRHPFERVIPSTGRPSPGRGGAGGGGFDVLEQRGDQLVALG